MPFIALGVAMIIIDATIVNVAIPTIIRESSHDGRQRQSGSTRSTPRLRGAPDHPRPRRRHVRPPAAVHDGNDLVRPREHRRRDRIEWRNAHLRPLPAGDRRSDDPPATLSTVNTLFRGRERAIAFAIWGSTIGGMAAIGPFLGGLLTTDLSWRWAFLINIPLGIVDHRGAVDRRPETSDPTRPRPGCPGPDHPDRRAQRAGLRADPGPDLRVVEDRHQLDLFGWPGGDCLTGTESSSPSRLSRWWDSS